MCALTLVWFVCFMVESNQCYWSVSALLLCTSASFWVASTVQEGQNVVPDLFRSELGVVIHCADVVGKADPHWWLGRFQGRSSAPWFPLRPCRCWPLQETPASQDTVVVLCGEAFSECSCGLGTVESCCPRRVMSSPW